MDNNLPLSAFTLFDALTLLPLVACIALAAMRSAVEELIALIGWLLSLIMARALCNWVAEAAFPLLEPREMAVVLAFGLVFVVMRLVWYLLGYAFDYFIKKPKELTYLNRSISGFLGLSKGFLFVNLAILMCSFTSLPSAESWEIAKTAPFFERSAMLFASALPPFLQDQVFFPRQLPPTDDNSNPNPNSPNKTTNINNNKNKNLPSAKSPD